MGSRIDRVETCLVPPRWLFVRIATNDGLVGWGEATLEGRCEAVVGAIESFSELLLGTDPTRIEDTWQRLTKAGFYRGGPILSSAVSGIDQALWDIAGKRLGAPIHELLGGPVREQMRAYCWIGGDEPAEVADEALLCSEQGYTAMKMNVAGRCDPLMSGSAIARIVERVESVQSVIGKDCGVAVDFHGRLSPAMARVALRALEPLGLLFAEEPTTPELSGNLGSLIATTSVPIATGERLYSRWEFREVLQVGLAIAQPDVSHAGGISEVRRIASLAEAYGVALAPHSPMGPIALAASLQIDFATPNAVLQEHGMGIHYNVGGDVLDYILDPGTLAVVNGYFGRPTGPGLGLILNEQAVREAARRGHAWRPPAWRHPDGAHAEW